MKSRLLLFLFAFCCECASAQTVDTIRIYFRRGYSTLEPSFRNNRRVLDQLVERLRTVSTGTARSISAFRIEGNASPDGAFDANERLGHKRVANTLEYIRSRVTLPDSVVSYKANGIDWDGLAQRVEADPSVPYGDQIVDIIRNTPIWIFDDEGKIIDGRKKQLMDLKGGVPYRYIEEHIFPELRNSTLVLTCTLSEDSDLTEPPVRKARLPCPTMIKKPPKPRKSQEKTPPQERHKRNHPPINSRLKGISQMKHPSWQHLTGWL